MSRDGRHRHVSWSRRRRRGRRAAHRGGHRRHGHRMIQEQRAALDTMLRTLNTTAAHAVETVQRLQADASRLTRDVDQLRMKMALSGSSPARPRRRAAGRRRHQSRGAARRRARKRPAARAVRLAPRPPRQRRGRARIRVRRQGDRGGRGDQGPHRRASRPGASSASWRRSSEGAAADGRTSPRRAAGTPRRSATCWRRFPAWCRNCSPDADSFATARFQTVTTGRRSRKSLIGRGTGLAPGRCGLDASRLPRCAKISLRRLPRRLPAGAGARPRRSHRSTSGAMTRATIVLSDRPKDPSARTYAVATPIASARPGRPTAAPRLRRDHRPSRRPAGRAPGPGARRHPAGVRLQPEGALGQGRHGPDAADASDRRRYGVAQRLRSRSRTSGPASPT